MSFQPCTSALVMSARLMGTEGVRDEILAMLESLCAEGLTLINATHDSAVARRARRLQLERALCDTTR